VLLTARAVGVGLAVAADALVAMEAPKGRGQRKILNWGCGTIEVIDESYNASPVSVRAAVATLTAGCPAPGGRRVAVLGDMLELGEAGPALHRALAETFGQSPVDLVFTAGPLMEHLHRALPRDRRGAHAGDSAQAASLVIGAVRAGDLIMVKGSAGSRMGRVVTALEAMTRGETDVL
jgi:UDP-N-acetylmuramoyl-tripeptide--D-alanyl-D-alanine ligase